MELRDKTVDCEASDARVGAITCEHTTSPSHDTLKTLQPPPSPQAQVMVVMGGGMWAGLDVGRCGQVSQAPRHGMVDRAC